MLQASCAAFEQVDVSVQLLNAKMWPVFKTPKLQVAAHAVHTLHRHTRHQATRADTAEHTARTARN